MPPTTAAWSTAVCSTRGGWTRRCPTGRWCCGPGTTTRCGSIRLRCSGRASRPTRRTPCWGRSRIVPTDRCSAPCANGVRSIWSPRSCPRATRTSGSRPWGRRPTTTWPGASRGCRTPGSNPMTSTPTSRRHGSGALRIRFNLALYADPRHFDSQVDGFVEARRRVDELGSPLLTAHTVKFFADGVVENETGALLAPYCSGLHRARHARCGRATAWPRPPVGSTNWACRSTSTPSATPRCARHSTPSSTRSSPTDRATAGR